jgi:septal ring factor EnvC (AmiA/AmiB activator)
MNNDGRKRIDVIIKDIEKSAEARSVIDAMIEDLNGKIADYKETFTDAKTMIEELRDEEQEKFDNLSEGLQASERGQNIEAAVSALDEAMNAFDAVEEVEDFAFDFDPDSIITELDNAKAC